MIPNATVRILPWLVPYACCTAALLALPKTGHAQQSGKLSDVQAVVRISKELIDDVVSKVEVTGTIPYYARILGFHVQGLADGRGKLTVEIQPGDGNATVVVHAKGEGQTYATGTLGPVLATGFVRIPFTSETLVRFNGRKFSLGETTPHVQICAELDKLEGRHGRLPGRAAGRLMRPMAQVMLPHAENRGEPYGDFYLVQFINELGGKIVDKLNTATRVEESLDRLFPETRDWTAQLVADGNFIQAAYGPRGSAAVVLPANPARTATTRMEIWLHPSNEGAAALAKFSKSPLAKELINSYLRATLPELAALTEERTVSAVGPWIVITIGPPKTAGPPAKR
jgi:hypothetical protein